MFFCLENVESVWIDISSRGKPVDKYKFTTTEQNLTPYIEWNDPSKDRSKDRCATIDTGNNYGHNPRGCGESAMMYICEYESE